MSATSAPTYERDGFTWAAYGALLGFGYLNAALGPILPYLRAVEELSYLGAALHQLALAAGGGLAGVIATHGRNPLGRAATIRLGLAGAAVAGIVVAYAGQATVTVPAALAMGFLNTSALIALWAALSDAHRERRAVAMTEGEVAVSLGGVLVPLLIAGLAATAATWRSALLVGAVLIAAAVARTTAVTVPERDAGTGAAAAEPGGEARSRAGPTLLIVFAIVALEFALSFWLASYLNASVGLERGLAVALVGALYAANLAGRLLASRLARRIDAERLLALALATTLVGLPILLAATGALAATLGFVLAGAGIGAMFPLTTSLHVGASRRGADSALGQVLLVAAVGEILGPLAVAAIAQGAGLRVGLLILPALVLLAAAALAVYSRAPAWVASRP
ncbi:MAG: MFS transporter [Solirubrobacterales bacterium]